MEERFLIVKQDGHLPATIEAAVIRGYSDESLTHQGTSPTKQQHCHRTQISFHFIKERKWSI